MSLAWGGHQNGRIPTSVLTPIGKGALPGGLQFGKQQFAHPAAAAAWGALVRAVHERSGVRLKVAEGYRDLALQQHYWNTLPFPMAASPGTSNHGWARAVDMYGYTSSALVAVRELAPNLGWSLATGDRVGEPWHIEYVGSLAIPQPEPEDPLIAEEDAMIRYLMTTRADGEPEYGVFGITVPGGSFLTRRVEEAESMGFVYGRNGDFESADGARNGSPWKRVTSGQFSRAITHYRNYNRAWAAQFAGSTANVTVELDYDKLAAALVKAMPKTITGTLQ